MSVRRIGLTLALGGLMVVVDTTVTVVAVPAIVAALDSTLPAAQWVTTGYLLGIVAVIPLAGWASERFGARRVYLTALLAFTVFSALAGFAWDAASLAVFRALQGLGGGLLNPVGQAIGLRAAPRDQRGRLMSLLVLPLIVGPVCGPPLAGWLIDTASWRWIFLINIPLGALALLVCARTLPRDPRSAPAASAPALPPATAPAAASASAAAAAASPAASASAAPAATASVAPTPAVPAPMAPSRGVSVPGAPTSGSVPGVPGSGVSVPGAPASGSVPGVPGSGVSVPGAPTSGSVPGAPGAAVPVPTTPSGPAPAIHGGAAGWPGPGRAGRVDWAGLVQLSGGAVLVVLGGTLLDRPGGVAWPAVGVFAFGVALLAAFVRRARRVAEPLVDLRVLAHRPLRAGLAVLVCFGAAYFGSMSVLPLFAQGVRGDSAGLVGTLLLPQAVAVGVVAQVATRLVDRVPARRIVLTGTTLALLGTALLTASTVTDAGYPLIVTGAVLLSAGSGITIMPTMTVALRDLPNDETPRGTTLLALGQQLASALGVAAVAVTLSALMTARMPGEDGVAEMLALDPAAREAARPGLAVAVGSTYVVPLLLLALSVAIAFRSLRPSRVPTPAPAPLPGR